MQVREYFVKTGVFHVLNTNRISADGTQTTSGALDTSPTDAQYGSVRANPDLLGTPALHGFHSGAAAGAAAGAAGGGASAAPGANPGATPYNIPTLSGRAFTDPSDHQARANAAGFALPTQAGLPITCNTDPLPQRSTHDVNQNRNSNQQGATISASMLSAPLAQLPAALPFPPNPADANPDRTAALRMQALMEAMHVMQTHGANSYAAQQAALLAQATGRLGGGVQPQAPPASTAGAPPTSGILAGDLDIMRQLASRMGAPKATSGPANGGGLSLPAALSQMMWAPQAGADANAQAAEAAAAATPASSTAAAAAAPAADSAAAAQGSGAPSGGESSAPQPAATSTT